MQSSSATESSELWETLASGAAAESPLWAEALRAHPEREPVFSPLAPDRFALGLETIYEGYLLHYGRSRLFDPPDPEAALLLGDYLYAHGLVRVAELGEVEAVATLAELISVCAHLRAEQEAGDGDAWVDAVHRLGGQSSGAGVERAVASHAARMR